MSFARSFSLACVLLLCAVLAAPTTVRAEDPPADGTKTTRTVTERVTTVREKTTVLTEEQEIIAKNHLVAIFMKNRLGAGYADKLGAFEDLVTGEITSRGYRVISHEDTIAAVSKFAGVPIDPDAPGSKLDEIMENNTSALRLAQNMGAEFVAVVSFTTYGADKREINAFGVHRLVVDHKLRSTVKILGGVTGATTFAGNVLVTQRVDQSPNLAQQLDVFNDLLADAAREIAAKLPNLTAGGSIGKVEAPKGNVPFMVSCGMQDLSVPEVIKQEDGEYILGANRYKLEALSVTVELDGIVIGSTPNQFFAAPGLHKMRLRRADFKDWEGIVNINGGTEDNPQHLNIAMSLTDRGREKWLSMARQLEEIKGNRSLNDAEVEYIKGVAQMMRQSGYRVQKKVDVKGDVVTDREPLLIQESRTIQRGNVPAPENKEPAPKQ